MPIHGLWTIRIAVTRRTLADTASEPNALARTNNATAGDSESEDGEKKTGTSGLTKDNGDGVGFDHDPTDWVSIRMGPNLSSLRHLADIKNIVNDDFGEVRLRYTEDPR